MIDEQSSERINLLELSLPRGAERMYGPNVFFLKLKFELHLPVYDFEFEGKTNEFRFILRFLRHLSHAQLSHFVFPFRPSYCPTHSHANLRTFLTK
jgi:hypothetical protein